MVESQQLSLFSTSKDNTANCKKKEAKLGRYETLQKKINDLSVDPNKIFVDPQIQKEAPTTYRFVDLFCGAGGMTQGLVKVGFLPIASVEINEIASATYRKNFPECNHFCGDIQEFKPDKSKLGNHLSDIHLVVGGPPCQGFSVAGKRNPDDPRNRLFSEFIRVVSEIKPWYVVMENVPGILTLNQGKFQEEIFQAFKDIGYDRVSVAILESAAYGVPQIRPRAIFIANRFQQQNPFPKPQFSPEEYRSIESAISDLPAYDRIPEINHEWTKHSSEYMERIAKVLPGESLYQTYADAFKRQYPGKPSMTIKENHGGTHIHPYLNRVISAREMARLQTFPDSFIFEGSMKKVMWQVGNAVPPRLAEYIGYALIPCLKQIALKVSVPKHQLSFNQTSLNFE